MKRYVLLEIDGDEGYDAVGRGDTEIREVAAGSAVQVVLAGWEELVPVEQMSQLRMTELAAAQRRAAERLCRAAEASAAGAN